MSDSMKQPRDELGHFVSLQLYIERILDEREKQTERIFSEREVSAEFKRIALKDALDEAKVTTFKALLEAKDSVALQLVDAKVAADERSSVMQQRIERLESGGAPFASRLDEGMRKLQSDVDVLNVSSVKAAVVESLRERQAQDALTQKRQIQYVGLAAIVSLFSTLLIAGLQYLG